MDISAKKDGQTMVLDIKGKIEFNERNSFYRVLQKIASNGTYELILNLKDVTYISDYGMLVFAAIYNIMKAKNGQLKMVGLPYNVLEVLKTTNLYNYVEIFESVDQAINEKDKVSMDYATYPVLEAIQA